MRGRAAAARVATLATIDELGRPRVVPCCFAFAEDGVTAFTAVDDVKPKSTLALRRLERIRAQPDVSLLVDHYDEDWPTLWWIRLDGTATVAEPGSAEADRGVARLVAKYDQYRHAPPPGAVISIAVTRWTAWP